MRQYIDLITNEIDHKSEFVKQAYHQGENSNLPFWRDSTGNEVDLLHTVGEKQYAFEIILHLRRGLLIWIGKKSAKAVCNRV